MILCNKSVAHPWQCDVMGHLTTRFYVEMFDDASYHFLNEVFGWTPAVTGTPGWADVRHTIEYLDEVGPGDLLEISAQLVKLGGKSITTRYEMRNCTRDNLAATLESVSVCFDLEQRKAVTISDDMRGRAQAHLAS